MTDLADFLLARIAEDEAQVTGGAQGIRVSAFGWHTVDCGVDLGYWARDDCTCRYVDRVLAECEAKRSVIAAAQAAAEEPIGKVWPPHVHMTGMADGLRMALGYLAAPYADHPDYRQEWGRL